LAQTPVGAGGEVEAGGIGAIHDIEIVVAGKRQRAFGERGMRGNLGPRMRPQPQGVERVVEIVSREPHDRQLGRQRWKQYEALGLRIQPHEVAA